MPASPPYRHVLLLVACHRLLGVWHRAEQTSSRSRGRVPDLLAVELTASAFLLILATMLIGVTVTSSPPWSSLPSLVC